MYGTANTLTIIAAIAPMTRLIIVEPHHGISCKCSTSNNIYIYLIKIHLSMISKLLKYILKNRYILYYK